MSKKIILFDISSKLSPQVSWSPNVWKARYVLNYKRLQYETKWVSYPDIDNTWNELGLSLLDRSQIGAPGPNSTLPVISVPSKDGSTPPTVVVDSLNIALYLDREYPDSPSVIPPHTGALQSAFVRHLPVLLIPALRPILFPYILKKLDDRGSEYHARTRREWYGFDPEKLSADKDAYIAKLKKAFNNLHDILNTNADPAAPWVMGTVGPTFADFALGSFLTWTRKMGDEELWAELATWNGGRWARLDDALAPYRNQED